MKEEKLLGVITRAAIIKGLFPKDVALAFTDKRLMFLEAGTFKGLVASSWFPIAGSLWAIKDLKEQDRLETLSVDQLEKKLKFDVPISKIQKIKAEGWWLGGGTYITIETESETYKIQALEDKEKVQKVVSPFASLLSSSPPEY